MSWRRNTSRGSYYGFPPYVTVGERKAQAAAKLKKLQKKGEKLQPVVLQGSKIASTFWGKAWCKNLESYMDYENRLPRGRSYVRNGSVLHLEIQPGMIVAKVAGSSLYTVKIQIAAVAPPKWQHLCQECAGQISSLLELLSGKLSESVMSVMTRKETGLFPSPQEIKLDCSCPDWATMCKHVAAVLYGVGARLDQQPDLLFLLRSVDQAQLISQAVDADITAGADQADAALLSDSDLADVFGIEIDTAAAKSVAKKPVAKKPVAKKIRVKKAVAKKVALTKKTAQKSMAKKPKAKIAVPPDSGTTAKPRKRKKASPPARAASKTLVRPKAFVPKLVPATPAKTPGRLKGAKDKQPRPKRAGL